MNDPSDYEARANREAAAIIMGSNLPPWNFDYQLLQRYVALGWIQGRITGIHQALSVEERAFTRLREDLEL